MLPKYLEGILITQHAWTERDYKAARPKLLQTIARQVRCACVSVWAFDPFEQYLFRKLQ